MSASRLVIGAGATGRTHRLRSWVTTDGPPAASVAWLIGSPRRPVSGEDVAAALTGGPAVIVADDLQWFAAEALDRLTSAAPSVAILASRRPADGSEIAPDALELLTEVLTRAEPAHRLGLMDLEQFGPALSALHAERPDSRGRGGERALPTADVEAVHRLTGGSIGLAADIVAAGWDPHAETLPPELVEAIQARTGRAGSTVVDLIRLWSVIDADDADDGLALARRALEATPSEPSAGATAPSGPARGAAGGDGERALRAAGLLGPDGALLPLVRRAAVADMTSAQRSACHDRVAAVLAPHDPAAAARHLVAGDGRIPGADRILATAALRAATNEPEQFARLVGQAERVGLPPAEVALLRALGAFHAGSPQALAHLEQAHALAPATDSPGDDRAALLAFGLDLRELRMASAAERRLSGALAEPLRAVARSLAGRPESVSTGDGASRAPLVQVASAVAAGLDALAAGRARDAVAGLVQAADDFDRLDTTAPLGFTPHGLGALAALLTGDQSAVEHLCDQAIAHRSGGPGEVLFHQLVRAHGRMNRGDYRAALDLLRRQQNPGSGPGQWSDGLNGDGPGSGAGPGGHDHRHHPTGADDAFASPPDASGAGDTGALHPASLSQRDRLLLASLEAAIARRSGDTGRLRSSWHTAEQALLRPSVSWLYTDVFTELLAAGARLGDRRRVEPVASELLAQALALPPAGPGPVSGLWLWLQIGIALDDREQVADTARRMADLNPDDERSRARVAAAAVWAGILSGSAREAEVTEVAARITAAGDSWEASRLLGQAALDLDDPRAARRLLELARVSATEPVDADSDDALVGLGLSEREAEVALMVVDGRTHKEIGAQLFISPKTVEHHVAKIRQKLGATSRAELVASIREAVGQA